MSYGKARAPLVFEAPSIFSDHDEFDQTGNPTLAGETSSGGSVWAGDGDAQDFDVNTSSSWAERDAVSDVADTGRYAVSGVAAFGAQVVQVDSYVPILVGGPTYYRRLGVLARYADTSNFLQAYRQDGYDNNDPNAADAWQLHVRKRVGGSFTILGTLDPLTNPAFTWRSLRLLVDESGSWYVWEFLNTDGPGTLLLSGQDSDLAVGGTLASGKPGFYDEENHPVGWLQYYDNFWAGPPVSDAAIFSGRSAKFLHDTALRESSDGTHFGRVPLLEGDHLRIPPAGESGRKSRIVVKARRFDVDSDLPDDGLYDGLTAGLVVTPRVLLTGGTK